MGGEESSSEDDDPRRVRRQSPRRTSRGQRISYAQSSESSTDEEDVLPLATDKKKTTPLARKRGSPTRAAAVKRERKPKHEEPDDNEDQKDSSGDDEEEQLGSANASSSSANKRGRRPPPTKKVKKEDENDGSEEDLRCLHCKKEFASSLGLNYHLEKLVCRPELKPAGGKRQRTRETPVKKEEESGSSSSDEESSDESDDEEEKPKRKRIRPARKSAKEERKRKGTATTDLTCGHCGKTMTSALGLEYHLEIFVCRPELKPKKKKKGAKRGKKRGPKKDDDATKSGSKKIRGALADRTCPKCKRVFTSVLGKDYHCTNRVCDQASKASANEVPFSSLTPGMEFVTAFGVVRVVDDSRASPTGKLPEDIKLQFKQWKSSRQKIEIKQKDNYDAVTVHSLVRRKRLNQLFEKHISTPKQVWEAYFGSLYKGGTVGRPFPKVAQFRNDNPNPMEPDGCHPDRIVECILVPDKRTLYLFHGEDIDGERECVMSEQDEHAGDASQVPHMRLYVRRKDLTVTYSADISRYCCEDCGKVFLSTVGARYHCRTKSCIRQGKDRKTEVMTRLDYINTRAERLLVSHEGLHFDETKQSASVRLATASSNEAEQSASVRRRPSRAKTQHSTPTIKPLYHKKLKKSERDSIYPQVWQALGFKIMPRIARTAPRVSLFDDPKTKKRKNESKPVGTEALFLGDVHDASALDSEYDRLKSELDRLQSAKLGAMYPGVYKVLQFRKPKPVLEPVPEPEPEPPKEPAFVPRPPFYQFPPAIIDVGVLAGEVYSGRYPSMARNSSDANEHADICYICKDSRGLLHPCDFCNRCNHLECIRSRFIIKDPEPHDDFMCNKCIQDILCRRRRAERRRQQKQGLEAQPNGPSAVDSQAQTAKSSQANGTVGPGKEFEHLAKRARHVDEIMHLLKDSQSRLKQLVETSRMNDFRRKHLMDS